MRLEEKNLRKMREKGLLRVLGRTDREHPFSFFWTASGIEFAAAAESVFCELDSQYESNEIWVDVLVDGARIQRILLPKGRSRICLAGNLDPSVTRTFSLRRDTQAMPKEGASVLTVNALEIEGTFEPLPERPGTLEFVGDSITSGEGGCGAVNEMDWKSFVFDSYDNYARMTADALNARYQVLSSSGWGVYCSFDGDRRAALPLCYEQVCGLLHGAGNEEAGSQKPWDFASFEPAAIVVNLGSNDWYALQGGYLPEDEFLTGFHESAVSFLKTLRRCNKRAKIVWALGMLGEEMREPVLSAIRDYQRKTGDPDVFYVSLPNTRAGEFGSRQHPGHLSHVHAAEVLSGALKGLLQDGKSPCF
ncbi:MAG: GDSL-type esterase/lipase family protein [Lachnospiraceae bacterium]|nr:GDSL-type esterase/lipase family protein [Lachnospiraceae bacterium]